MIFLTFYKALFYHVAALTDLIFDEVEKTLGIQLEYRTKFRQKVSEFERKGYPNNYMQLREFTLFCYELINNITSNIKLHGNKQLLDLLNQFNKLRNIILKSLYVIV